MYLKDNYDLFIIQYYFNFLGRYSLYVLYKLQYICIYLYNGTDSKI